MNRRESLTVIAGAAAALTGIGRGTAIAQAPAAPSPPPGPFVQPPLPFLEPQLAPTISNRTVTLHYGKHHASYYANLNNLTKDTKFAIMKFPELIIEANKETDRRIFNNAGQAWNHELYWAQFKPGGAKAPGGKLAEMINASFGSFDEMKNKLKADTTAVFGSGWGWLAQDGNKLVTVTTAGGDNPITRNMTPLLGIDVWEHAYYLDYENRRPDHIQAVLDNIVNWDAVAGRLRG
jgi:superoxide dismutase, Fe-Mn family